MDVADVEILSFSHIGFAVPSVEEFRSSWGRLMGIEDWVQRDVPLPAGRIQVDGVVVDEPSSNRIAFAKMRGTSIELIEPLEGRGGAASWLAAHGPGIHHIGVWVADLEAALDRVGDAVEVTYSPTSLVPTLADRPAAAMLSADAVPGGSGSGGSVFGESGDPAARPPFWAYVQPVGVATGWHLELLDARFEAAYREYYGDYAFYPGDLPDGLTLSS